MRRNAQKVCGNNGYVIARSGSDEAISRRMEKLYCVYIMTNKTNTVFYTGITSNLNKRIYEHKENLVEGFTKKYNVHKNDVEGAILREKQIEAGSRNKKIKLINSMNPNWKDLYYEL